MLVGFPPKEKMKHSVMFTPAEFQYYADTFKKSGFRGGLNWYRYVQYHRTCLGGHDLADCWGKPRKECGEELEVELRTGEPQNSPAVPDDHSGQGQSVASLGQQAHGAMGTHRPATFRIFHTARSAIAHAHAHPDPEAVKAPH